MALTRLAQNSPKSHLPGTKAQARYDSPAVGSAKHLPSFRATEEANGLLGRRGICPTKTDCSLIDHLKLVRQGRLVGQSCGGFKNWRCAQGLICKRSIGTLGVCVRKEGMGKGGMRYNVVAPMSLCRCKYSSRSISPRA